MAEAVFQSQGTQIDINSVIKCIWCKGNRDSDLVKLGCFHLGCKTCLRNVRPGSHFICPACGSTVAVPQEGVEGFPKERLQKSVKQIGALLANDFPNCMMCEIDEEITPSTHFCTTCKSHLCARDARRHTFGSDHNIINHEDLQSRENIANIVTSKSARCVQHSSNGNSQILKFFCQESNCKVPVCQDCVTLNHSTHSKITIKQAAGEHKKILKDKAEKVSQEKYAVDKNIKTLERTLDEIKRNNKHCSDTFKQWGEDMKRRIDKTVEENTTKVDKISNDQIRKVEEILQKQTKQSNKMNNAKQYIDVVETYGTDFDIVDEFQSYIDDAQKCLGNQTCIPILAKNISVQHQNVQEREKGLKNLFGEIVEIESPFCKVQAEWKSQCCAGLTILKNHIFLVKGDKLQYSCMDGSQVNNLHMSALEDAWDIDYFKNDIYLSATDGCKRGVYVTNTSGEVRCVVNLPQGVAGDIGLSIDKRNGDIFMSTFESGIIFKCKAGMGAAFPFISKGLNGPSYLCVSSKHEVIVSNFLSDKVCKFSPSGELIWTYGGSGTREGQFEEPHGICVDDKDYIFVADRMNDRIHFVSPHGKFISYVDTSKKLESPIALAFSKGSLIITQLNQTVQVVKLNYKIH